MIYTTGCYTIFHHRYHIVLTPKCRHKALRGEIRERVRTIVRQVCKEMGVTIVHGILSTNHVHMFAKIPPHITVSRFLQRVKGHSSRKAQQEFPALRKRYWGQRFWARGYFCRTSGNITDAIILLYLEQHSEKR